MLNLKNQKGFAAFFVTILVLVVIFEIAISLTILTLGQEKISGNIVKSTQSYYAAEAGIEDSIYRIIKGKNYESPNNLPVGEGTATISITTDEDGSKIVKSSGAVSQRIRTLKAVCEISSEKVSFYYGAQVGEGGIKMDNEAAIEGNVFSNGSIIAKPKTLITGTVKVAKTGNYIDGATIREDAYVDICKKSDIWGTLTCTDPGSGKSACTASSIETLTEEISPLSLPISQSQIDDWEQEAESGGIHSGDYILQGQSEDSLGPIKIEGKMTIQDKTKLFVTGTIWVTGEIVIKNEARVRLDQSTFGSSSGIIISDDKITLENEAKGLGSGKEGSYLMFLSTGSGDAITIKNEFEADILYTQNGWIIVQDHADIKEITGYGIQLKNKAKIIYKIGLEDTSFSTGPGGGWQVTSWKETE